MFGSLLSQSYSDSSDIDFAVEFENIDVESYAANYFDEIIGEAVNRVVQTDPSVELPDSKKIIDTRNRIIHGYDVVSDDITWSIILRHLSRLKEAI